MLFPCENLKMFEFIMYLKTIIIILFYSVTIKTDVVVNGLNLGSESAIQQYSRFVLHESNLRN